MLSQNPTSNVEIDGKSYNTFTEPPVALAQERANAKFPIREMTYFLDGGKRNTDELEKLYLQLERAPDFENNDFYDLNGNYKEVRKRTMIVVAALAKMVSDGRNEKEIQRLFSCVSVINPAAYTRVGVHYGLFLNGVRGSGTPEQFNFWVAQGAANLQNFFGCFCMTELGHGSNVAGLETTATYDKSTQEFVINTPTTAATKWWIGGAAHTATHTLCFARLIVDGKDYGVKNFVVPLRDRTSWNLLPGIAIGDIGKKMGRDGIDNGWVQFTNVRIPRLFMMQRYSKVTADGKVVQPPLNQLSYGALIGGRVSMVSDSYTWARRFLTIAIRYSATRRQFASTEGAAETKLLDYTYHQRRLLPRLAFTYAMSSVASELYQFYFSTVEKLDVVSTSGTKEELNAAIEDMKELFSLSAGLKAFCTWGTAQIIDECRQACGGLGYSGYNGFGQAYADWVVQCTWEGDNNVLMLSAGRALIQTTLSIRKGNKVGAAAAYISRSLDAKLGSRSIDEPEALIDGWQHVAANHINLTTDKLEEHLKKGLNLTQALEQVSQQRVDAARLHTRMYMVRSFFDSVSKADKALQPTLLDVAKLFGLWCLEQESSYFLRYNFFDAEYLSEISELVNHYNAKVREQAIPLVDAFNQSDFAINAPIGNYDGNVYKNYFAKVNERNPRVNTHAPYYKEVMEPFFKRELEDDYDLADLEEEEAEDAE